MPIDIHTWQPMAARAGWTLIFVTRGGDLMAKKKGGGGRKGGC